LRENLTSSSYGEGLETDRTTSQVPRQSLTRQLLCGRPHKRLFCGLPCYVALAIADLLESPLKHMNADLLRVPSNKETIIGFPGSRMLAAGVFGKDPNRVRSKGDNRIFEELRVSDRKDGSGKINIAYRQR
jgi:hypothetical protein